MKVKITWRDDGGNEYSLDGQIGYENSEQLMDQVQIVVDHYEDNNIDIDQGGDEAWHELFLIDYTNDNPETHTLAKGILKDIEDAMSNITG